MYRDRLKVGNQLKGLTMHVLEHGNLEHKHDGGGHQLALVEVVQGEPAGPGAGRAMIHLASHERPLAAKMLKDTAPAAAEQLQPSVQEGVRVMPVKKLEKRQLVGTETA